MHVAELWRYPVKGLRGEKIDGVDVTADTSLPFDRCFAIAHGNSGITPDALKWADKESFHMLMHKPDACFAELTPAYNEASGKLTILRHGKVLVKANVASPEGIGALNIFFDELVGSDPRTGKPSFVGSHEMRFGNVEEPVISLINLASVRDLAERTGHDIDVARFRGNVLIDDVEAWAERDWLDKTITIGDVCYEVMEETIRCGATMVNPETCEHDLNIPVALRKNYGHLFCGLYLIAKQSGPLATGATLSLSD